MMNAVYGPASISKGVTQAFLNNKKGSLGNRMDCLQEQVVNNVKTNLQAVAAGAAIGGATYTLGFTKKGNKIVEKGLEVASGALGKFNKKYPDITKNVKKVASGLLNKFKSLPKTGKIAVAIGTAAAAIAGGIIGTKQVYKAGQIDQKYTDKAQLQNVLDL